MFSAQLHYKIKSLVSSLQKKNYSQTVAEINSTLEMYHENDRVAVISSLLDDIDFRGDPKPKDEQKVCCLMIPDFNNLVLVSIAHRRNSKLFEKEQLCYTIVCLLRGRIKTEVNHAKSEAS